MITLSEFAAPENQYVEKLEAKKIRAFLVFNAGSRPLEFKSVRRDLNGYAVVPFAGILSGDEQVQVQELIHE